MSDQELTFDERVKVMKQFFAQIGRDDAAAFACHLQESIHGLTANNEDYVRAYSETYAETLTLRAHVADLENEVDFQKTVRTGQAEMLSKLHPQVRELRARVAELEAECDSLIETIASMELAQIELPALRARIAKLEARDDSDKTYFAKLNGADYITDGFGNFWPARCIFCGALMQVVRPGDARCSKECYIKPEG